jgi:polyribonucleotide 5'-hydroxyl-kinase
MMTSTGKKEWIVKKECELRCELNESSTLSLRVTKGTAEIFGMELAPNKEYTFRDQNIAVFTWYGCTIETSGVDSALYVADSTPMVAYMNTHIQLESRRDYALAENETGPRVSSSYTS